MANRPHHSQNQVFVLMGLGTALLIAVFLSPFASSNPDGLDRVSQDQGFDKQAQEDAPAKKLPFYAVFEEYGLRGVPEELATPLAGLIGTLTVFGIAWGSGKLLVKGSAVDSASHSDISDETSQ